MNILQKLPQEDKCTLWKYLDAYSDGTALPLDNIDHFLRFWGEAKAPFYQVFGEKFILKKEIFLQKPEQDLKDEMYDAIIDGTAEIRQFCINFKNRLWDVFPGGDDHARYCLENFVSNTTVLVNNLYEGPSVKIPGSHTKDGRDLLVNKGCKAVKMLGKIANALGCEEGYEEFRQAHSQVLNQKKIKGNLCLSIHPLDFLTMSDNSCGWTSCMSWMEDYGDYRLGTIEMMNSPNVIIAYVEASEPLYVCGTDWSNKRWRQLYIVSDKVILGNRQYPYYSDEVQGIAIRWIKDLMSLIPSWGPYDEEASTIYNQRWNTVNGSQSIKFYFECNYMYNDVYEDRLAFLSSSRFNGYESVYHLNFSGPAVCTGCGDEIEYETVEAHRVQCRACDGSWRCDCCGDWHSEYDESYYVDDEYVYCHWCYHNELEPCEVCGERTRDIQHIYIQVLNTDNEDIISGFNYNYHVSVCGNCDKEEYEPLFGPMYEITDHWGYTRKAFDVRNITDKGLSSGDLPWSAEKLIRALREATSEKEMLDLIQKFSY